MGCICSKFSSPKEHVNNSQISLNKSSDHLNRLTKKHDVSLEVNGFGDGSSRSKRAPSSNHSGSQGGLSSKVSSQVNSVSLSRIQVNDHQGDKIKTLVMEKPQQISRIISMPRGPQGEQVIAGWPSWLSSVAGEAIQGLVPLRADSFEKLEKIGQGTYSNVYKARNLETGKLAAMKKVRFVNMDPESVRFMAREILILRRLDHPNIMKLEGLVASKMSGSLYLVFEYMEHDLAGLSATYAIKFTEAQIKCYVQQLLAGLEHCHNRGVLHRDIKGSNLLINDDGVLKIADFGLANFFRTDKKQPLTSRVVTLWYRAPELLLGSTDYGIGIDMWSVGCIVAELYVGKPIMSGRTEVEQMHKIFKLCGSPSESYWKETKFPHATSFKPHQPYKRRLTEIFKDFPPSALSLVDSLLSFEPNKRGTASIALKSEFFTTNPLPCDPSSLPKYQPLKEFDVKRRGEETRRKKAEAVKGRGPESVRRGQRVISKATDSDDDGVIPLQGQKVAQGRGVTASRVGREMYNSSNEMSECSSMVHPSAIITSSWGERDIDDDSHHTSRRTYKSMRNEPNSKPQISSMAHGVADKRDDWAPSKENGYASKKSRMHYSGPLFPPGGNMEDMLKEHERQIQQAVRKSQVEKDKKNNSDLGQVLYLGTHGQNCC